MNYSWNLSEATYQWLDANPYAWHERDTVKASLDQTTDATFNTMKSIDDLLLEKLQKVSDRLTRSNLQFIFNKMNECWSEEFDVVFSWEEKTRIKKWIIDQDEKSLVEIIKKFGSSDFEGLPHLSMNYENVKDLLIYLKEISLNTYGKLEDIEEMYWEEIVENPGDYEQY